MISEEKPAANADHNLTKITLTMKAEDLSKLMAFLEQGRAGELGIHQVTVCSSDDPKTGQVKWTRAEQSKRDKSRSPDPTELG